MELLLSWYDLRLGCGNAKDDFFFAETFNFFVYSPVVCKLFLYHLARTPDHHHRIIESGILVSSVAILWLLSTLLHNHARRCDCRIIAHTCRYIWRCWRLLLFLQLRWIKFSLFRMKPRRLDIICRLLNHFPIGNCWRDWKGALYIYWWSCWGDDERFCLGIVRGDWTRHY